VSSHITDLLGHPEEFGLQNSFEDESERSPSHSMTRLNEAQNIWEDDIHPPSTTHAVFATRRHLIVMKQLSILLPFMSIDLTCECRDI
jgi:phospholipase/lecithinase/hemolysin